MLSRVALLFASFLSSAAVGQVCTGLCLQQVSCTGGATTTISGTIYAPNGTDPIPGALVYVPNAPVAAFTPGVSCSSAGQLPSGSPLVGTTTAVDGTFTLANVPVGINIPLVVQSGRWRRQISVPSTSACVNTPFSTRLPRNQGEGDIPKIAVVTGSADAVECVLRKVGIDDAEFTDPSGNGRINVYFSNGAKVDPNTPSINALATANSLNSYDVLMLPCEGSPLTKSTQLLESFLQFANAGGRVYASHYSYTWLYNNPPFNSVVQWAPDQGNLPDGTATINTSFAKGQTLSQWLSVTGASATPGQIPISTLRKDFNQLNAPTQSWLTLNNSALGNPVMQFTFDTPVNSSAVGCGRVLYDEYHVENQGGATTVTFPSECRTGTLTAQEKLLEFNLFDLTSDGEPPTLTPASQDFGSVLVGASSSSTAFTWRNNTPFPVVVSSATASGDFHVTGNTCSTVAPGASCEIGANFAPTAIGAETGTLKVVANTGTLTSALTGTGVTPFTISSGSLDFGKVDLGASASQTLTLSNVGASTVAVPTFVTTGDFSAQSTCSATLSAKSSCVITVSFRPAATGTRTGTLSVPGAGTASLVSTALTGTGVDFSLALTPASASTVAGNTVTTNALVAPIAGFANQVTVSCTTSAPASKCTVAAAGTPGAGGTTYPVTITTTSPYIGQVGMGRGCGWLGCLLAGATGLLILRKRLLLGRSLARVAVLFVGVVIAGAGLTGCGNIGDPINLVYTNAGAYTYTVTATDGTLTHSATYTLTVSLR